MKALRVFCVLLLTTQAMAMRFETGQQVIISQPVEGDLYVSGGTITINAPIRGDLIAAGGTIIVNDSVRNDILMAGGTIVLKGYVGDDIRCVGNTIHIAQDIAGDVLLAAGMITIDQRAHILGDLMVVGRSLTMNGQIDGELTCKSDTATINGQTNGKAMLTANELSIGQNARFGKTVRYWNQDGKVAFGRSVLPQQVRYDVTLKPTDGSTSSQFRKFPMLIVLWYLGTAFLTILLINYVAGRPLKQAGQTAAINTLSSVGTGFLFFLAVPVAAIVAYISTIGVPVGIVLTLGYITVLILAPAITSIVLANMIDFRSGRNAWPTGRLSLIAMGILVGLQVALFIPVVGWLVLVGCTVLAFGSLLLTIWPRKSMPVVVPPKPALS